MDDTSTAAHLLAVFTLEELAKLTPDELRLLAAGDGEEDYAQLSAEEWKQTYHVLLKSITKVYDAAIDHSNTLLRAGLTPPSNCKHAIDSSLAQELGCFEKDECKRR